MVLDEVSYDFVQGQTHVILGSSGSGKSTLLRMVLGLIEPSGEKFGSILRECRPLHGSPSLVRWATSFKKVDYFHT
jgi:ABC-type multidrug transport system ATPase subunit